MSAQPSVVAKIELKTQELNFIAEGEPHWLAKQLDKILETLRAASPRPPGPKPQA